MLCLLKHSIRFLSFREQEKLSRLSQYKLALTHTLTSSMHVLVEFWLVRFLGLERKKEKRTTNANRTMNEDSFFGFFIVFICSVRDQSENEGPIYYPHLDVSAVYECMKKFAPKK